MLEGKCCCLFQTTRIRRPAVTAFDILSALMLSTCGTKGACHDSQTGPWMHPWTQCTYKHNESIVSTINLFSCCAVWRSVCSTKRHSRIARTDLLQSRKWDVQRHQASTLRRNKFVYEVYSSPKGQKCVSLEKQVQIRPRKIDKYFR